MYLRDLSPEKHRCVVLIHGQVFDGSYWNEALPSFDARLLVPDLCGLGASSADVVSDFEAQETQLEAALLAKNLKAVHLVGYSLGSYHALALALRGKLKVASLMMLGPWPGADSALLNAFAGMGVAVRSGLVSWVDAFLANCFTPEFAASHPATVAATRAQITRGSVHALLEELAHFPRQVDLRPRLNEVKVPFLVRVGQQDLSTPAAVGEAMKQVVPHLQLEVVPGVAHHYLAQDFEGTVASIKRFTGC